MLDEHFPMFFKPCKSREDVAMVYIKLAADISRYPGTDEEKAHILAIMDEVSEDFEDLPYETDFLDYVKDNAH